MMLETMLLPSRQQHKDRFYLVTVGAYENCRKTFRSLYCYWVCDVCSFIFNDTIRAVNSQVYDSH